MKFGPLIKYNAGNVFFFFSEYHTQNVVEKRFLDPFLKIQNGAYLRINGPKFYTVCFVLCQASGYQNILKLSCRPFVFNSYKALLKNKKRSGTSLTFSA